MVFAVERRNWIKQKKERKRERRKEHWKRKDWNASPYTSNISPYRTLHAQWYHIISYYRWSVSFRLIVFRCILSVKIEHIDDLKQWTVGPDCLINFVSAAKDHKTYLVLNLEGCNCGCDWTCWMGFIEKKKGAKCHLPFVMVPNVVAIVQKFNNGLLLLSPLLEHNSLAVFVFWI